MTVSAESGGPPAYFRKGVLRNPLIQNGCNKPQRTGSCSSGLGGEMMLRQALCCFDSHGTFRAGNVAVRKLGRPRPRQFSSTKPPRVELFAGYSYRRKLMLTTDHSRTLATASGSASVNYVSALWLISTSVGRCGRPAGVHSARCGLAPTYRRTLRASSCGMSGCQLRIWTPSGRSQFSTVILVGGTRYTRRQLGRACQLGAGVDIGQPARRRAQVNYS
jgi:hypothetical protein